MPAPVVERPLRVGAKLANFGPSAHEVLEMAAGLEAAGVDSVWLSDRIITTRSLASVYPFTDDGAAPWSDDTPFLEAVTVMAMAAAATRHVEIGVGVLVLPLRSPVLLAKQLATIDVLSGGRVALGVGGGWMAEEYEALGVPFAERGARTDEAVAQLRACWDGTPEAVAGPHYPLPDGVLMHPRPPHRIPIFAGGMTAAALRRAAALDGWFGYVYADRLEIGEIAAAMRIVGSQGRRGVLRIVGAPELVARAAPELLAAGIGELVIDVDWRHPDVARHEVERVRDAAAHTRGRMSWQS